MNVTSTIELYASGTSEGADKAWDTRGRGRKLSDKAERALKSFIPVTAEKVKMSALNAKLIADAIGGKTTPDNHPYDVLTNKVGIEVKTIIEAKNDKVTVHKESRERKQEFQKKTGITPYIAVVDMRPGRAGVYIKEAGTNKSQSGGGWSFRLRDMISIGSFKKIKDYIK